MVIKVEFKKFQIFVREICIADHCGWPSNESIHCHYHVLFRFPHELLLEVSEYFSDHDKVFCSEVQFAFFLQGKSISSTSTFHPVLPHFLRSNYLLMSKIFCVENLFLRNKIMGVLHN